VGGNKIRIEGKTITGLLFQHQKGGIKLTGCIGKDNTAGRKLLASGMCREKN
jgi:hypothetical protein